MKIGNIEIEGKPAVLAPMAGFSDVGMRALCCEAGAAWAVTEMVSAKALVMGSEKTLDLLKTDDAEKIKVVQLFGGDPEVFGEAVRHEALKKFDIIDINMGCPVNKIIKNGEGSSLMKMPERAAAIVRACVEGGGGRPVTVKMRKGFAGDTAVEFARVVEAAGAAAICVHGRTARQGYSGAADWGSIRLVKDAVKIPVFANGDVIDAASCAKCLEVTGADGVLIGRGALGNPQIFQEITFARHHLSKNNSAIYSKKEIILRHLEILERHDALHIGNFKGQLMWYSRGFERAKELRKKVFDIKTKAELTRLVEEYF